MGQTDWRLLSALAAAQIISWGTLHYSFPVLWEEMSSGTGWPLPGLLLCFGGALLISGAAAPASARLIGQFGGRRVMAAGSLLSAIALALISLGGTIAAAGWLVLGLAMATTLYEAAFAAIAEYLSDSHGRAAVVITLTGGFAGTIFFPLTAWLSATLGWQKCLWIYSALHFLTTAPLCWVSLPPMRRKRPPKPVVLEPNVSRISAAATAFALQAAVFAIVSTLLILLLERAGIPKSRASSLAVLIGPAQVAARIMLLSGPDPDQGPGRASKVFVLLPLALIGLLVSLNWTAGIALSLALYGACNGASTIVRTNLILAWGGPSMFATMQARIAAPSIAARAVGPLAAAIFLHRIPDPQIVLATAAALAAVSTAILHLGTRGVRPFSA